MLDPVTGAWSTAGECKLVSRNGNVFHGFKDLAQWIGEKLAVENAVLDGEVACVDDSGRAVFTDLLFHRGQCFFFAFDLLFLNGEDLRGLPLIERKTATEEATRQEKTFPHLLRRSHRDSGTSILSESLRVGSRRHRRPSGRHSLYRATEKPSPYWIKVKNPAYSQAEGREELFERN